MSLRRALLRPEELTLSDVFREDFLQERSEEESVPGTSVTRAQAMSGAGKQNGAPQRTSTKEMSLGRTSPLWAPALPSSADASATASEE